MDYQDSNSDGKAVWNMDDEILKIIKDLKRCFLESMMHWKLEDAYWYIDLMCMECYAELNTTEQEKIDGELKKLEILRQTCKTNGNKNIGEFYKELRNLYKEINCLMVKHQVWFRKFEDDEEET